MKKELSNASPHLISFFFFFFIIIFFLSSSFSLAQNTPQDYLHAHNDARSSVGVGYLIWNNSLAMYALNISNERIGDCNIINSQGPYGENIAWSNAADFKGTDAVKQWTDQRSDYDRNTNTCKPGKVCMHYIQVVWRKTEMLGCAKVRCTGGGSLITCCYDPPGNIPGQIPY